MSAAGCIINMGCLFSGGSMSKTVSVQSWARTKRQAAAGELAENWIVSISDLSDEPVIRGPSRGVLRVKFDDITEPWRGRKLVSEADIIRILDWCRDKDNIVVHCHAGQSRSPAVAYLIECLVSPPAEAAARVFLPEEHSPNMRVIKIGARVMKNPRIFAEARRIFGAPSESGDAC
jgi:predicted protein tyrosine phosphatase